MAFPVQSHPLRGVRAVLQHPVGQLELFLADGAAPGDSRPRGAAAGQVDRLAVGGPDAEQGVGADRRAANGGSLTPT